MIKDSINTPFDSLCTLAFWVLAFGAHHVFPCHVFMLIIGLYAIDRIFRFAVNR